MIPEHLQKQNSLIAMESTIFIQLPCILCATTNALMPGGNRMTYIFKQTCSLKLQICLSMYDLLLQLGLNQLFLDDNFILIVSDLT